MNKYLVHLVVGIVAILLASGCSWHVKGSASATTKSEAKAESKEVKDARSEASAKASGKARGSGSYSASATAKGNARVRVYGTGKGKVKYSKKASPKVGRAKKPKSPRFKYKVSYKNEFSGKYKVGFKGRVESSVSAKGSAKASAKGSAKASAKASADASTRRAESKGRDARENTIDDAAANRRRQDKAEHPEAAPEETRTRDRRDIVEYTLDDSASRQRVSREVTEEEIEEEDAEEIPLPPEEPPANEFGYETPVYGCFEGEVMFIEPQSKNLPTDYSNYDVASVLYACEWDIPVRAWETGFPGLEDKFEWFAIRYSGAFHLQEAGTYTFRINSDDGTKLYIDGQLVVDNDGTHPPRSKSGSIELTAGDHELVLEYFQGPRYHIALQVFVTPPGGEEGIFSVRAE